MRLPYINAFPLILHLVKLSILFFLVKKIPALVTNWTCTYFSDLTNLEVYKILQLRNEVFIVEQDCVYPDCDEKDFAAHHLCAWQNDQLVAYTRLLPPGISFPDKASIGRVLTAASVRRQKLGIELMERSIQESYRLFGPVNIAISAQLYLRKFYESFSFVKTSEVYLEDNIPHIHMELNR